MAHPAGSAAVRESYWAKGYFSITDGVMLQYLDHPIEPVDISRQALV